MNHQLLLLFILLVCGPAQAETQATLYLHGETHDSEECAKQRATLARSAAEGHSLFFTENAFTSEWTDPWSTQISSNLIGTVPFSARVRGLESPYSWTVGLYYQTQANFDRFRSEAFEKFSHPDDPRSNALRKANLNKARAWLDMLLSDSGICENEPVRSVFCRDITYDSERALSYRDEALTKFIQGPATQILSKFGQSVQKRIKVIQSDLGIPSEVQDPREREWVQAAPGKSNSRGQIDYQIIWRNYVMEKNLSAALQTSAIDIAQDVHVVLGAAHVRHFYETLKRDYPAIAERYRIKATFECVRPELQTHFSFTQ